ncbi:MAG: radical SAM/SPASM domain-containing protein [bacterium]
MEGIIGVTYRCNAKCVMCDTWRYPTRPEQEIKPEVLHKLPAMQFTNITGGEPFVRNDLAEIVHIIKKKTKRIVISTNGFFTDRIIQLAKENKDIGIRISIEGLPKSNDELRGIKDGFDKGLRTLLELKYLGIKDIGFGITVSDRNAKDLLELYRLADAMHLEFATAVVHNSYYFHKFNNEIKEKDIVAAEFQTLVNELLKSKRIKNWYRAYFNHGIINYVYGRKRLLPCEVGSDVFYLDPFGDIRPCNAMDEPIGNLNQQNAFAEIWNSPGAKTMRQKVATCDKQCWMIGSVSPAIKKYPWQPTLWVLRNKFKL